LATGSPLQDAGQTLAQAHGEAGAVRALAHDFFSVSPRAPAMAHASLATEGARRPETRPPSSSSAGVAVHPCLRGLLARSVRAVLRRAADGSRLPAALRSFVPASQGNGKPLDAARADVGRRACAPCRPGLLPLAG